MGNARLKVLLVDDDEGSYLVVRHLLCKGKIFDLRWVASFDEGLKAMAEGDFDVCLLDYHLGAATGVELLRKAVSQGVRKPVIMLTGSCDGRLDSEATLNGASDFLRKDELTPVFLEHSIRHALEHFTTLNALQKNMAEVRRLEREVQEASEREQRRLGQDLHDGLGQTLTGIAFLAKALEQTLRSKKIPECAQAGEISRLLNESLLRTRRLSSGLCPVVLENNDITAALHQLAGDLRTFFGVVCVVKVDPKIKITDNDAAVNLYRIAQEATTNAVRHGHAKKIQIDLVIEQCRPVLRVSDNGVGFPEVNINTRGMGLRVMQHRASVMGASLDIQRQKKGGTTVVCSLENNL